VASQKSQSHAAYRAEKAEPEHDPQYLRDQNERIMSQIASRTPVQPAGNQSQYQSQFDATDRQSEKSFKSFTQTSQHQKYSKNEPNFKFWFQLRGGAQEEMKRESISSSSTTNEYENKCPSTIEANLNHSQYEYRNMINKVKMFIKINYTFS